MESFRASIIRRIEFETINIAGFQRACGITSDGKGGVKINNWFLYYIFCFGATLGNEITFATFLPFLFWTFDDQLARNEILLWATVAYVGQCMKDVLMLPRPKSPPVHHLEDSYISEYGLPSTHAMSAITLSCYLFYFLHTRYELNLWLCVFGSLLWILITCASRPYLGVHSFLDVYVGLVVGVALSCMVYPVLSMVDGFLVNYGPAFKVLCILTLCIILVLIYPNSKIWTSCYGDTCRIIGACTGAWAGVAIADPSTLHLDDRVRKGFLFPNTPSAILVIMVRAVVGYAFMQIVKSIIKYIGYKVVPSVVQRFGLAPAHIKGVKNDNRYIIEIPVILMSYISLSFVATHSCPMLFNEIGIGW
ncbi:sphingosine-1-phosphate phosphatase SGPP, partial [Acrasis kona]